MLWKEDQEGGERSWVGHWDVTVAQRLRLRGSGAWLVFLAWLVSPFHEVSHLPPESFT